MSEPTCPDSPEGMPRTEDARDQDRECARRQADREAHRQGHAGPPLDFATFIFSLATQAFVALGETEVPGADPAGGIHLESAKQLIDILALLEAKTKGNLSEAETHLVANLLYDLRMRYVRLARAQAPAQG